MTKLFMSHILFFFSSRRRHTRLQGDWSSDVCSSDLCGRLVLCLILRASLVIRAVVAENAAIHAQFSLYFRRDVRQLPKQGVEPLGVLPFQILFCLLLQGCEVLRGSLLCGRALIGKDGDLFAIASLLVLP